VKFIEFKHDAIIGEYHWYQRELRDTPFNKGGPNFIGSDLNDFEIPHALKQLKYININHYFHFANDLLLYFHKNS